MLESIYVVDMFEMSVTDLLIKKLTNLKLSQSQSQQHHYTLKS